MRKTFSSIIEKIATKDEKIIFITGDLGYNALENVRKVMGDRFINAGVAEQNMISLAAGMAYKGYKVFCYSIAPFIVYRCLEQFRNDVCFHNLPVCIVGNGGGYGYGIMGSSHHAIEDIACLSGLPNATCWIPAFVEDVEPAINSIIKKAAPAYLRLGLGNKNPFDKKQIGSFSILLKSQQAKATVISLGPIINNVVKAINESGVQNKLNLYTCNSLPLELPAEILKDIAETGKLLVVEEHISIGGLAQQLSVQLLEKNIHLGKFKTLCAKGYPNALYGDQEFHQKESGIDVPNILSELESFLN
jgi:transketolase